jgi:hypothetical protein
MKIISSGGGRGVIKHMYITVHFRKQFHTGLLLVLITAWLLLTVRSGNINFFGGEKGREGGVKYF